MKNQIIIREAISEADTAAFWEQLHMCTRAWKYMWQMQTRG